VRRQVPGDGPTTEGVADDEVGAVVGKFIQRLSCVAGDHIETGARTGRAVEHVDDQLDQLLVDLEHRLIAGRTSGLHPGRQRECAATEVHHVDRPVGRELVDHLGEPAYVPEVEMGGIVEIDVAVAQIVEHEHTAGRSIRVVVDRHAVVGGLAVARAAECCGGDEGQAGERGHRRDLRARRPPDDTRKGQPECDPAGDQQHADGDDDGRHRRDGHQHESRQEGGDDRASGAVGGQPADRRAGGGEVAQLQLDHRGRDCTQHGGRWQEAHRCQHHDPAETRRRAARPDRPHGRHGGDGERSSGHQEDRDQPSGIDPVRGGAADPRPDGDAGQHRADDARVRLDAHPDIGGEQSCGEDLQHQNRSRRADHECNGQPRRQW
jgi:hypothetical protein